LPSPSDPRTNGGVLWLPSASSAPTQQSLRDRFDTDVAAAPERLVQAAGGLADDDRAADAVMTITSNLPVFTGLVESARTYNRLGLPLGQTYLGAASRLVREAILPAAAELHAAEYAASTRRSPAATASRSPWSCSGSVRSSAS
jgi:hypothetical protein